MPTYIPLGSRRAVGEADTTGRNVGNWTVSFPPDVLNSNMPYLEVYKIVIHGAVGSTFDVYVEMYEWDTAVRGDINSWDPTQPLILFPGQTLYFFWSDPITDNSPPTVSIWLRYDQDNWANQKENVR